MPAAGSVTDDANEPAFRIGVITEPLGAQDLKALRFLILHLNTLQHSFQFEIWPGPKEDPLLALLASREEIILERVQKDLVPFVGRLKADIQDRNRAFTCQEPPPDKFVILSKAHFSRKYYSTRKPDKSPVCAVIALGYWKRSMAPPTEVEFFLVLLLRQAVALVSPSLEGSVHLGTKGCLCDFDELLADVRYKVLNGFICDHCTQALIRDGHPGLKQELLKVLGMEWLGTPDKPGLAASIASNLGHNLFITKGLKPTPWESARSVLPQEVVKLILAGIGAVLATGLAYYLGWKTGKP